MKYLIVFLLLTLSRGDRFSMKSSNPLQQEVQTYLDRSVKKLKIPGIAIAITRNDSIIFTSAIGVRNIETKERISTHHIFHWASVSKTFVAVAILQLVESGKISLDGKLLFYLPYFTLRKGNYKEITIRQMLNHTSGIGDVQDYEWDKPEYDEGSPEKYVRSLCKDTMLFHPGTSWEYSNTAYDILGVVIAQVSGMPFETYIRRKIFDPLQMSHSSFLYPEIPDSLRVDGHELKSHPVLTNVYPYNRIHAPSSTLNSSVIEMTYWARANLHRGKYRNQQILSDSSYDLLWKSSVNGQGNQRVGLSWFMDNFKGLETISHGGGDTGFSSFFLLIPEKNISLSLVSNYDFREARRIAFGVLDIVLDRENSDSHENK